MDNATMVYNDDDSEIEPYEDKYGCTIVNIGDFLISSGRTKAPNCKHKQLTYDRSERRIWCVDCKRTIDGFDAFIILVDDFAKIVEDIRYKTKKAEDAMNASTRRRAAKCVEQILNRNMAVTCPHCYRGLLGIDFDSIGCQSADLEIARRKKTQTPR